MATLIVTCINKDDRLSRYEAIKMIGGGSGPTRWRKTQHVALEEIRTGQSEFFVEKAGRRVKVIRERHSQTGNWYLKTEPDGTTADNLLALPECL
jgi:hypothetical protein